MEQGGASAVVFHSLFEEQIEATAPEFRVDPNTYLENIGQAKRAVGIPIIGSLNCTTLGGWISYARRITAMSCRTTTVVTQSGTLVAQLVLALS